MLDSAQTILFLVIVILTVLLVILGIQVFFILRDVHKTVNKTNNLLDSVNMGTTFAKVGGVILSLLAGKNLGSNLLNLITKDTSSKSKKIAKVEEVVGEVVKESVKAEIKREPKKTIRRFFRRK